MNSFLLVGLGGAVGAVLRYFIGLITGKLTGGSNVVTGTVVANITGCFLGGFALALFSAANYSESAELFITIGILGAFTTFSTFTLEVANLKDESFKRLITYLFLQLFVALGFVAVGFAAASYWMGGA